MQTHKKITHVFLLAGMLSVFLSQAAFAKTYSHVSLNIDTTMETGMVMGEESFEVTSKTNGVNIEEVTLIDSGTPKDLSAGSRSSVQNPAYYDDDDTNDYLSDEGTYNKNIVYTKDGKWHTSNAPVLKIKLSLDDNDSSSSKKSSKFNLKNSSDVTLSGNSDPKFTSASGTGATAEINVTLNCLRTGIAALNNVEFDQDKSAGFILRFGETTSDMYYNIRLYRNDKSLGTYTSVRGENLFDFTDVIKQAGTYKAYVRVKNVSTKVTSGWVEVEDTLEVTSTDIEEMANLPVNSMINTKENTSAAGRWMKNESGWWWQNADGSYPHNAWQCINGHWYWFNQEGYTVSGWQNLNNKLYFFYPEVCNMATGWIQSDNSWYYADPVSGCISYGWKIIGGKYYYFDKTTAVMLSNTTVENGYILGADGAWTGGKETSIFDYYKFKSGVTVIDVGKDYAENQQNSTLTVKTDTQPLPGTYIAIKGEDNGKTVYRLRKVLASYLTNDKKQYLLRVINVSQEEIQSIIAS